MGLLVGVCRGMIMTQTGHTPLAMEGPPPNRCASPDHRHIFDLQSAVPKLRKSEWVEMPTRLSTQGRISITQNMSVVTIRKGVITADHTPDSRSLRNTPATGLLNVYHKLR